MRIVMASRTIPILLLLSILMLLLIKCGRMIDHHGRDNQLVAEAVAAVAVASVAAAAAVQFGQQQAITSNNDVDHDPITLPAANNIPMTQSYVRTLLLTDSNINKGSGRRGLLLSGYDWQKNHDNRHDDEVGDDFLQGRAPPLLRLPPSSSTVHRRPRKNKQSSSHVSSKSSSSSLSSSLSSSSFEVDEKYYQGIGVKDVGNLTDFFWLPAEPSGAASRTTLVSVCNPAIEIRNKGRLRASSSSAAGDDNFHNPNPNHYSDDDDDVVLYRGALKTFFHVPTDFLDSYFWTKVVYDEYKDRFVVAAAYINIGDDNAAESKKNSSIYIAVSTSGSPKGPGDWYIHAIDGQGFNATTNEYTFVNNIGVQVGPEAIYITASRFGSTTINLYEVVLFIVAKAGLYDNGGTISYSTQNPFRELSSSINDEIRNQIPMANDLFPAHVYDGGPNIGNGSSIGTFLVSYNGLLHIGNTSYLFIVAVEEEEDPLITGGGAPSFSWNGVVELGEINQAIPTGIAPDAPQLGSATGLSTFGTNVFDAVWRNNTLWIVTTVVPFRGPNANQTTAYWIKINTDTVHKKFRLEDHGEIGGEDLGAGTFTFFPAVAVNSRGVAAFGFGASGPWIHPGAYVAGRTPKDPKGSLSQSFVVKEGVAVFNRSLWGYFSAVSVDPVDDDSFWVYNAYADEHLNLTTSKDASTMLMPGMRTNSTVGVVDTFVWSTVWRRFRNTDCNDDISLLLTA